MSELFREISKEEFDSGIANRLKLGEFSVGSSVTLSADMPGGMFRPHSGAYRRAMVNITEITPITITDYDLVNVKYEFELSRIYNPQGFKTGRWGTVLWPDSIAWTFSPSRAPGAYFSHHALETWEHAAISELSDIEVKQSAA